MFNVEKTKTFNELPHYRAAHFRSTAIVLPGARRLSLVTVGAAADTDIDPPGSAAVLGLAEMGEIKSQLGA